MYGIKRLSPDLLSNIMLTASSIDEKFALAQVSKLWRNVALDNPLFWSSFTGGGSKADCYRVALILEPSGFISISTFRPVLKVARRRAENVATLRGTLQEAFLKGTPTQNLTPRTSLYL